MRWRWPYTPRQPCIDCTEFALWCCAGGCYTRRPIHQNDSEDDLAFQDVPFVDKHLKTILNIAEPSFNFTAPLRCVGS